MADKIISKAIRPNWEQFFGCLSELDLVAPKIGAFLIWKLVDFLLLGPTLDCVVCVHLIICSMCRQNVNGKRHCAMLIQSSNHHSDRRIWIHVFCLNQQCEHLLIELNSQFYRVELREKRKKWISRTCLIKWANKSQIKSVYFNRLTVIKLERSGSCVITQISRSRYSIPKVIFWKIARTHRRRRRFAQKQHRWIGLADNESHTAYDLHNKFNCWRAAAYCCH